MDKNKKSSLVSIDIEDGEVYFEIVNGDYLDKSDFSLISKEILRQDKIVHMVDIRLRHLEEFEANKHKIKNNPIDKRRTFIYLMKDEINDSFKIGMSKNPKTRESTLQSEKPYIKMINYWEGEVGDEKSLHKKFKNQRIRGEWFILSEKDLLFVESYFRQKSSPPQYKFQSC